MGIPLGNRAVASACVVSPASGDRSDVLIERDLVQQLMQHRCITDVAGGDLDRPNLQRFLIDPYVYLAQDTPLGAAVPTGIPLAFAPCLDARAVNQKVQRVSPTTIRQVYVQRLLTAAESAEIRHSPARLYQLQQALNETCRLPKRHAEHHLLRQAGLDRGVTQLLPPPAFSSRRLGPDHLGIKPD
jgi:hypothetical protein